MERNRKRLAALVAAAALAGGGAGAGAVALTHDSGHSSAAAPVSSTSTPATSTANGSSTTSANVASSTQTIGEIARSAIKSVVEIDSTSAGSSSQYPFGGSQSQKAEGTGWVYDTKGDIVTNEHVVDGASSVTVKFSDGSSYKGTIVGKDVSSDLAVVHVNAPSSKLVPLSVGDSNDVQIGDGVVAIGNPFGLDGTVTSGIVSAVNRVIQAPDGTPIAGAIQTDAAINHGNSGGVLLNTQGKVIGVTSQIQSESGGNEGVGFAIPSDTVRSVVDQLIAGGTVQHALLGISPADAPGGGAKVQVVEAGTAAKDAGVQVGDVITAVDGKQIADSAELRAVIESHQPGDKVTLTIRRDGATKTLAVTLGARS
jgi:putative serine protease PepD